MNKHLQSICNGHTAYLYYFNVLMNEIPVQILLYLTLKVKKYLIFLFLFEYNNRHGDQNIKSK